jgi:hypothetical protein
MIATLPVAIATLQYGCECNPTDHVCRRCINEIVYVLEEIQKGMQVTKKKADELDKRIDDLDKYLKDFLERGGM